MLWHSATVVAALVLVAPPTGATDRPIIGILSQEIPFEYRNMVGGATSYVAAAYVKAVEASGARVVPVLINRTEEYYKYMMSSLNGLLLPGGDADLDTKAGHCTAARTLIDMAHKMQDSGVPFPVLGVCQGLEVLMFVESKASLSADFLTPCYAAHTALPLNFRPGAFDSRLYKMANSDVLDILKLLPVTSNHHKKCITEKKLKEFHLDENWRVLTTNKDFKGVEFISTMEHVQRPIIGIQFHPEKNMYEWNPVQANPHFYKAVLSARLFYDWLVVESRANDQRFADHEKEMEALIYNYNPIYTGGRGGYDEQVYFF